MNENYHDRWREISRRIDLHYDEDMKKELLHIIENVLEDMRTEDMFGTEGQVDPRGDFRNGNFSVWNMEGYDGS